MRTAFSRFTLLFSAAVAVMTTAANATSLSVAAAANLTYVIDDLNAAFRRSTPEVKITTTFGASGNLFAQIANGAPFDLFLSADTHYPAELARGGGGDPGTLQTFAIGRLVLWTTRPDLNLDSVPAVVRAETVRKLAIAHPSAAPYGQAAQAALEKAGVWAMARGKLVVGESVAQAAQFVETGNADAGFVALSQVTSARLAGRGRWIEVPPALYSSVSLAHACILTRHGATNPAGRRYLTFLRSAAARGILAAHGYALPP